MGMLPPPKPPIFRDKWAKMSREEQDAEIQFWRDYRKKNDKQFIAKMIILGVGAVILIFSFGLHFLFNK